MLMSQGGKPAGYSVKTLMLFCDLDASGRLCCLKHGSPSLKDSQWGKEDWPKLIGLCQRLNGQAYEIEIPASMPDVNMAVLNDLLFNKSGIQSHRLQYLFPKVEP